MKLTSTVRLLVLITGLGVVGNLSAQCDENAELGNGNWKEDILAAEQRLSVLEMELKNSLTHQQDCISSSQGASSTSREDADSNNPAQPGGDSGAVAQQTVGGQGDTGSADQGSASAIDSNRNDAVRVGAEPSISKVDFPDNNGDLRSEENELERVLREAIEKEPDSVKRRALIERYRQLFGEYISLK